jgi:palmitoyl-protein thioesterase
MHFIYESLEKVSELEKNDQLKNAEIHETPFYELQQDQETGEYIANPNGSGVPTAMFHGFGDACINPGDINFDRMVSAGTNAPVHCIEVGIPSFGEVFNNFEYIAQQSCQKVAANKDFHGEFNVVGLSQGGLIARYIAEECEMPGKVRNVLTIGGPHMGVDAIPGCFTGTMCKILNFFAKQIVYTSFA